MAKKSLKKITQEAEAEVAKIEAAVKAEFDKDQTEATSWIKRNPKTVLAIAAGVFLVLVWVVLF